MITITFVPILATCACTAARAPWPMLTMAITAPADDDTKHRQPGSKPVPAENPQRRS